MGPGQWKAHLPSALRQVGIVFAWQVKPTSLLGWQVCLNAPSDTVAGTCLRHISPCPADPSRVAVSLSDNLVRMVSEQPARAWSTKLGDAGVVSPFAISFKCSCHK